MYLDEYNKKIILLLLTSIDKMIYIRSLINKEEMGYKVFFYDNTSNKLFSTKSYISDDNIKAIKDIYNYLK